MLGGNLPLTWSSGGRAEYGPNALSFAGEPPTQLRLGDWFHSSQVRSFYHSGLRFLISMMLLAVLLCPLPVWAALDGWGDRSSPPCPGTSAPAVVPPATTSANFKLSDSSSINTHLLAFDRSRNTRITELRLTPEAANSSKLPNNLPTTAPTATINGFLTRDDGATLNANLFYTQSVLQSGQVLVTICARRHDRANGTLGDPGTYTGTVSVAGVDVVRADIPIVVTLAYPAWQLILELLVLVLIPAAWYLWVLHDTTESNSGEKVILTWGLVQYGLRRIGFLPLAIGAIAAFSVYTATYLRNDSWGSNVTQVLSLYGAMFTAFIAAASGVHLGAKASGISKP
jgi:hypothetical protein